MLFVRLVCKTVIKSLRSHFSTIEINKSHILGHKFQRCSSSFNTNDTRPSQKADYSKEDVSVMSFDAKMEKRRGQAQRSIIVQVQSEQSCAQLYDYCSHFGNIASMHHYTVSCSTGHFILMEFSDKEAVSEALKACGHNDRSQIIPTHSHMLWFRASQKRISTKPSTLSVPLISSAPPVERAQLIEWLHNADTISDQIMVLYRATRLDDLGERLRYITAHQLEAGVSGLFPRARVLLFGSSANGFGRQGCDLDLVLQLDEQSEEEDAKCRLMFHAKPSINARSQVQRHIDGLADLIQWFLPGCTNVRRILLARVPIVKYHQELTDIECDLSLTNMTAVYMTEMLYTYVAIDWRVQPLVFTVKRWASEVGLTNPSPGRWITNFSLTLLVIFYLQIQKILPSLDSLRQRASKTDSRMSEDGVNCTFLRDVSKITPSNNMASLESLLIGFLEYYSAFDFTTQGIALGLGTPVKKRDHSALYIVNPLETHLNVSQNVSFEETERLKMKFRDIAWELELSSEQKETDHSSTWGLLRISCKNSTKTKSKQLESFYFEPKRSKNRLMPVKKLFEDDDSEKNDDKSKVSKHLQKTVV